MARQQSQIEEVEKQVTDVSKVLQHLYAQLGELALPIDTYTITNEAKSLFNNFSLSVDASNSIKAKLSKFTDISASFKNNSHRLKELAAQKKNYDQQLKLLYSKIGVIVWEESSSDVIDPQIIKMIPEIIAMQEESKTLFEIEKKAKERYKTSFFLLKVPCRVDATIKSHRLKKHTSKYKEFFIRTGRTVATQSLIPLLHSSHTTVFEKEYKELIIHIAEIDEESTMIAEQIRYSHRKLEQEGINGSLAKKINEIENELREANKVRNHAAILYGKYIAAVITHPDPKKYSSQIIDVYEQIMRQQELKTELLRTIKRLTIEKKIEELVLLLQQDEEHVAHIELSIGQLNRQIEEINKVMASKKEQIGALQQQLNKVLLIEKTDGKS